MRANRVLVFREQTIDARLVEIGFSPEEAREIHLRWVKSIGFADVIKAPGFPTSGVQGITAERALRPEGVPQSPAAIIDKSKFDWYGFWRDMEEVKRPYAEILKALMGREDLPPPIRELAQGASTLGRSDEEIVQALKVLTDKRRTVR